MKFKELKRAYKKAVAEKKDVFSLEGHLLVIGYAKYLIQYLTSQGAKDDTEIELTPQG